MASNEDVARVRSLASVDTRFVSQPDLSKLVDVLGVYGATADLWRRKAAEAAVLVDTSESGSSRSMSQIHKNALAMAAQYAALAAEEVAVPPATSGRPMTRAIERI